MINSIYKFWETVLEKNSEEIYIYKHFVEEYDTYGYAVGIISPEGEHHCEPISFKLGEQLWEVEDVLPNIMKTIKVKFEQI